MSQACSHFQGWGWNADDQIGRIQHFPDLRKHRSASSSHGSSARLEGVTAHQRATRRQAPASLNSLLGRRVFAALAEDY